MTSRDWNDLASVYRAGSSCAAGWVMNSAMQQHAEILEAQADRCDEIARERDGNPPVVHDHLHMHTGPGGRKLQHRHRHSHGRGKSDHDLHPVGHEHERDPFAPPVQPSPARPEAEARMSTQDRELDIGLDAFPRDSWKNDAADALMDAIDLASDQDQVTWLTEDGKRVAAIVPVDMAEHLDGIVLLREDPAVQDFFRRMQ